MEKFKPFVLISAYSEGWHSGSTREDYCIMSKSDYSFIKDEVDIEISAYGLDGKHSVTNFDISVYEINTLRDVSTSIIDIVCDCDCDNLRDFIYDEVDKIEEIDIDSFVEFNVTMSKLFKAETKKIHYFNGIEVN